MKRIAILGSTGSIGTQALDVCRKSPEEFAVTALTANRNIQLLEEQVREFSPSYVCVTDESLFEQLKMHCRIFR